MTTSTRTTGGRTTGAAPLTPPRPIPVPRVVGNRRVRAGGIALAAMLLALGAALSGIALVSATRTGSYLAVAREVPIGQVITADDLMTVELSGGAGLDVIPADQENAVLGKHAATTLKPRALLVGADLTDNSPLRPDQAQIGLGVRASALPSPDLAAGDQLWLVPLSPMAAGAGPKQYPATVIAIGRPGPDGTVMLSVAVDAGAATDILHLNANGGLALYLTKPAD
ncbi:MAG TPA: flagellar biosynthesis protein FlgA [Micromonosporaceae bacterium]|nr:flagellar biosynthesis protein FlgA [Micromonosporaceae bacterium]